jgi:hypothetical protein
MRRLNRSGGRGWVGAAVVLALAASGCGTDPRNSPTAKKLRGLASLYTYLATSQQGRGPATEAEFRRFVREAPAVVLSSNRVELTGSRDDLFVSDRDQRPFVICYGVNIQGMSATKAPLVAYEKEGKNGKHLVAYANMQVDEVDGPRLQELLSSGP